MPKVTVVKYAPIMLDHAKKEFPSLRLMSDSREGAVINGTSSRDLTFTRRVATVTWETENPERVDVYD